MESSSGAISSTLRGAEQEAICSPTDDGENVETVETKVRGARSPSQIGRPRYGIVTRRKANLRVHARHERKVIGAVGNGFTPEAKT